MSESDSETGGIRDEDLPEDLQPGEDNPLAEPLEEDVDRDELDVHGGKSPEESDDDEDGSGSEGSGSDGGPDSDDRSGSDGSDSDDED